MNKHKEGKEILIKKAQLVLYGPQFVTEENVDMTEQG